MSNLSNAEKLTNSMFRRSLILKIIVASFALLIVVCFSVFWIDNTIDHGSFNLDEGMEETLKELGPTTKFISSFEVEYKDGFNKSLIRIKSNGPARNINRALEDKKAGGWSPLLNEYPDIDAYTYCMTSGYITLKYTIRHTIFGQKSHIGYWRSLFEKEEKPDEDLELPKYRHFILLEIKKESDNCYWIYAEMNHPDFANDVMKEAVRQINALDESIE